VGLVPVRLDKVALATVVHIQDVLVHVAIGRRRQQPSPGPARTQRTCEVSRYAYAVASRGRGPLAVRVNGTLGLQAWPPSPTKRSCVSGAVHRMYMWFVRARTEGRQARPCVMTGDEQGVGHDGGQVR
jgi:hypothetical protein